MEYEFAFPYKNEDLGGSLWQMGKAYQIAILVGASEEFTGVNEDTWMSAGLCAARFTIRGIHLSPSLLGSRRKGR